MTSEESSEDITTNSPIKLQPTELTFLKASLTHADTANLTMINTSDDLLSFKIKTTRPKRHVVVLVNLATTNNVVFCTDTV